MSGKVSRQTSTAILGTYSSTFTRSSAALTASGRFITTTNLHILSEITRILDTWPNRSAAYILYVARNHGYWKTDTQTKTAHTRVCTTDKEGGL